jgi:hypothetical protein
MKGVADEDIKRLVESQHDLHIDGATVARNDEERASFDYTQARLRRLRAALLVSVLAVRKEGADTIAARAALAESIKLAIASYGFARSRTRSDLLDLNPLGPKPDPVKQAALAREWEDSFALASSSLERLSMEEQLARLDACCVLISQSAPLAAHHATAQLRSLIDAANEALTARAKEVKEETAAMASLRVARADFDLADDAHALQVRSILTGQGRIDSLAIALRRADPAYKARRIANLPIAEDPLVDDLSPELPELPSAGV